ncbi:TPA: hypothetical protein PXF07_002071 [Mannheimia haemolytica]|uniref:Uncharacterized protein n=3 Tax=Mannheimia haemolytica TaxID=75985 RepID=A0A547EHF3_MANHA|nr:hypothetical protein [Mannheimia haemolytica]AGI31324.1 hypothetical protein D650_500 [Mannheimia haemolytica USDA-ARS-USMARC-183]AGI34030.1 hypothetical protein D648_250 [Mannheimia haemolytica USDA-ARS-USMARC-185]AGK01032.1 hypothetical protein MHH_c05590 [Mannheimia haemolytica M42548]AJE06922.1 hypothetical protein B824_1270 [Mannheimia haemolytica USDA-ARS-USMARC-184]AWW70315.1 hypothetical protein C4O86_00195 [Pasteurellaceae bacterium 12565]EEY10113.1 hypothetical protein COI_1294 [
MENIKMEELKLTEKELLVLKGNALRMRFKAETNKTKNEIMQPFKQVKQTGLALVNSPAVKTIALDFLVKRLLSMKGISFSVLGLTAFFLLQQKHKRDDS